MSVTKKLIILFASTSFGLGTIAPVFAQNDTSGAASAPAMSAAASTAKPTKAQKKQARKEARAKKNAELKKLEDAGYQPGRNDPNYPQDLQNAQKKAGIGQGASQ